MRVFTGKWKKQTGSPLTESIQSVHNVCLIPNWPDFEIHLEPFEQRQRLKCFNFNDRSLDHGFSIYSQVILILCVRVCVFFCWFHLCHFWIWRFSTCQPRMRTIDATLLLNKCVIFNSVSFFFCFFVIVRSIDDTLTFLP